ENYALIPDSGGAGKFRGGLGVERVSRARSQITVNSQIDRVHCKPWGLNGGLEAAGNELAIRLGRGGEWQENFNNAKFIFDLKQDGDAFRIRSGGGGGYGKPWEREIESVREDVRQGYVSVAAADELYGVVIDAITFIVDVRATERKRKAMAARQHKEK